MKMIAFRLLMLLALSACGQLPATASSAQGNLSGTTIGERRETLRLACLNEAEWSTKESKKRQPFNTHHITKAETPDTARLKSLCRAMDELHDFSDQDATRPGALDEARRRLAVACEAEIRAGARRGDPARDAHANRMKRICEEMTHRKMAMH
jgi:hypothetical protein